MFSPTHITTLWKLLSEVWTGPLELSVEYRYDVKAYSVSGNIPGLQAIAGIEFDSRDLEGLPHRAILDELKKLWPEYVKFVNEALERNKDDLYRYL